MNLEQDIICAKAVLNFLNEDDTEIIDFNSPMLEQMNKTLDIFEKERPLYSLSNMCDFVLYINEKYKIMKEPLWDESATEFFSEQISHDFLQIIINKCRLKKLESL